MPGSNSPKRFGSIALVVVTLCVMIAAAAVAFSIYVVQVQRPLEAYVANTNALSLHMSGLDRPVINKLDGRYTDTHGNLVADPPADVSRQIDPDTLVFSYIATEDPEPFRDAFKELCDHVSKATGKTVRYELFKDTDDELKALRDGTLHIAGFSTGTVPMAVDACGFVPICRLGGTAGGDGYHMLIIVPAGSPIKTLADLKGHELGLTEPNSNSGYKAALVLLSKDNGLEPGRDFGIRYSGGQETSIAKIANKSYEAAAVASDVLDRAVASGSIKKDAYRVVYSSELFPTASLGYVYNLKPELAAKVSAALLDFNWSGTGLEKQFGPTGQTKFIPVDYKQDWALVRRVDDAIGSKHVLK